MEFKSGEELEAKWNEHLEFRKHLRVVASVVAKAQNKSFDPDADMVLEETSVRFTWSERCSRNCCSETVEFDLPQYYLMYRLSQIPTVVEQERQHEKNMADLQKLAEREARERAAAEKAAEEKACVEKEYRDLMGL